MKFENNLSCKQDDSKKTRTNEDYIKMIELYTKELNKVISGAVVVDQTSKYLQHIDQLQSHIDEVITDSGSRIKFFLCSI